MATSTYCNVMLPYHWIALGTDAYNSDGDERDYEQKLLMSQRLTIGVLHKTTYWIQAASIMEHMPARYGQLAYFAAWSQCRRERCE